MMKSVSALAVMMALSMTVAVAKDLTQDQKAPFAPAVKGKVMSDADMDKVTAGTSGIQGKCTQNGGNCTTVGGGGLGLDNRSTNNGYNNSHFNSGARFAPF
jgi:opacity protein-like surface antigen